MEGESRAHLMLRRLSPSRQNEAGSRLEHHEGVSTTPWQTSSEPKTIAPSGDECFFDT